MKNTHFEKIRKKISQLGGKDYAEIPTDISEDELLDLLLIVLNVYTKEKKTNQISAKLLDATPNAVIGINEKHKIIYSNKATTSVFGYEKEELVGEPIEILMPERYAIGHNEHVPHFMGKSLVKLMGNRTNSLFGLRKNQQEFPIGVSLSYTDTLSGKIALAAIRDATEELEIRATLEESKNSLESLFELSPDSIIIHNTKEITDVNQSFLTLFGYSKKEEVIGAPPLKTLVHPDDYKIVQNARSEITIHGKTSIPFVRQLKKDGSFFTNEVHVSSISLNGEPHLQVISRDISNRLQLEAKFERSETKFRDVFDSMIDLFLRVNNDGVMEMVSPSVFHITGYKEDEIIGKKAKDYYENSKDRDNLIKIVKEKGFCHSFEAAIITKEGKRKVLSINARIYSDANGEPLGIESISRDITKQKETENELYENRQLLNEAEHLAHLGSWVWDIKYNIISFSEEALRIYGMDKSTHLPTYEDWINTIHPEDLERVKNIINRLCKTGGQLEFEYRIICSNGDERILQSWSAIENQHSSDPLKMVVAILDITEQKKIKQNLSNSIAEFKDLFESSGDEICLVEPNSMKIVKVNETLCHVTGYTKKELEGKKLTDFFPMTELIKNTDRFNNVLKNKTEVFQTLQKKKCGTTYPVEIKIKLIEYKGKKTIFAILRDITKRIQTTKRIARFSQIFEDSLNEIFLFDTNSLKFVQVNNVAQKNLGYTMEEFYNLTPVDIKPMFTAQSFKKLLSPLLTGKKNKLVLETVHQRKDKSLYNVEVHLQKNVHETESLFVAFILDITKRKQTEKKNAVFNAISNKLTSNLSTHNFSKYVFSEIQKIKPFPNVYIYNYDELKNEIALIFNAEKNKIKTDFPNPRKNGNGLSEFVIKTKKGLLLNGEEVAAFHKQNKLKTYGSPAESWVGVPLLFENRVVGVLVAQSFQKNSLFTSEDLNFLSFIGTQIGSLVEREKAEKEIKQFEKYFSVSMDLLCIAGTDGFFRKINPKFSEVLGYSEKELLSREFTYFIHPEDIKLTLKQVEKLSRGISTINFVNRYRCKNNEYKCFMWTSTFDPNSNMIYAAARDISEQKKSEEILTSLTNIQDTFIEDASTEETFEKILKALLNFTRSKHGFIGEVLYNSDGTSYLNTNAITSVTEKSKTSDYHEKNGELALIYEDMKSLLEQVINNETPVIVNNLNGDDRKTYQTSEHVQLNGFMGIPFYKKDKLVGIVGLANKPRGYSQNDIDLIAPFLATCSTLIKAHQDNKKREKAESEVNKLADIVSYSSDAIISTDQNGTILSWNIGAEKILGYSRKEIIGTSIDKLKSRSLREAYRTAINEVRNGKRHERYETLKLKKGYVVSYLNMSIFPLIDESGNVKGISSILRDITDQKTAQKAKEEFANMLENEVNERTKDLRVVQKRLELSLEKEKVLGDLKSRFVATASHQFRTPLAVIQASIGILEMQKDLMSEQFLPKFDKAYSRIIDQIGRMTNLMDEVLILGKINDGKIKPILKPVSLIRLCTEVSANYNEIQPDGRKVKIKVIGAPESVLLDEKLFEQALSNLISNAFKYSVGQLGPLITISFNENYAQISVKDYGIGIPNRDLHHLFEPFYRASNVNEVTGTGLGSAIAKEYIELNGGTINVKSELKIGSEFIIILKKS